MLDGRATVDMYLICVFFSPKQGLGKFALEATMTRHLDALSDAAETCLSKK